MSVEIRPVSSDQLDALYRAQAVTFGFELIPELTQRYNRLVEIERLRAAYDGDQIVATFGALSFRLSIPGGVLPAAGTTAVTVLATHRRRGILRSLMREHMAEVHQRNEPLAVLWASESSIYGRFGFGPASERALMTLAKPFARMQQPPDIGGTMRLVNSDEAQNVLPPIYQQAARLRPGMFERSDCWWRHGILSDPKELRQGATALRPVLHVRDGEPAGYVLYRTRMDQAAGTGELLLVELIAVDAEAEKALWQYLFGIDLVTSIKYWNQPVDDALRWWLEQPRRMERRIQDALWVRPVDVCAALRGRRYSCAGTVVLRLRDDFCPWNDGVFRLEADAEGNGRCEAVESTAEIELSAHALGAIYLGGHRLRDLSRAGLVSGTQQALARADAMFAWHPLPWCQEIF